jgi:hypothetical protein
MDCVICEIGTKFLYIYLRYISVFRRESVRTQGTIEQNTDLSDIGEHWTEKYFH